MNRRIYLASSWRNARQPYVLGALRHEGHDVYDFRNPAPGVSGFAWSDIDPYWEAWDRSKFVTALGSSVAQTGFRNDWEAMEWADTGVLLLPSGRSAHLEGGYFAGHPDKELHVLMLEDQEPELMYKMANTISTTIHALIEALS